MSWFNGTYPVDKEIIKYFYPHKVAENLYNWFKNGDGEYLLNTDIEDLFTNK